MKRRLVTKTIEPLTAPVPLWKVLVHDDPVTTFSFVQTMLGKSFGKGTGEAHRIAQEAHDTGVALVTVLPLETAEFKVEQAHLSARAAGFPLTFSLEPAD